MYKIEHEYANRLIFSMFKCKHGEVPLRFLFPRHEAADEGYEALNGQGRNESHLSDSSLLTSLTSLPARNLSLCVHTGDQHPTNKGK